MSKLARWLGFQKPKTDFKLPDEVKEKLTPQQSLGYINPLWEVNVYSPNGDKIISKNLLHIVHTYLKDYGFEPDNQTNPSLIVGLKNSMGEMRMPLFIKQDMGFNPSYSAEEARNKGMLL